MCGIAGKEKFNNAAGPKTDRHVISKMMARRGPDNTGLWSEVERCTMVFRPLANIDLSSH